MSEGPEEAIPRQSGRNAVGRKTTAAVVLKEGKQRLAAWSPRFEGGAVEVAAAACRAKRLVVLFLSGIRGRAERKRTRESGDEQKQK